MVVGVHYPADGWIDHVRRIVDAVLAAPVGRGIAAAYRLRPVEAIVTDRDELRMKVRDMAVGIRIDRVVRRVRAILHSNGTDFSSTTTKLRSFR